jgi:hypothetical protein
MKNNMGKYSNLITNPTFNCTSGNKRIPSLGINLNFTLDTLEDQLIKLFTLIKSYDFHYPVILNSGNEVTLLDSRYGFSLFGPTSCDLINFNYFKYYVFDHLESYAENPDFFRRHLEDLGDSEQICNKLKNILEKLEKMF